MLHDRNNSIMFSKVKKMSKTNQIRNAFSVLEQAKKEGRPLIVFDTETTGFSSVEDALIQVSAQKIDPESFKTLEKFDVIINPMRPVSEKITEITGYTNEFLATKLPEEFVFMDIFNFFGENPIVAGHNADFDIRFMKACYQRNGKVFVPNQIIDTCKMSRQVLKRNVDVPNHQLETVAKFFGVDAGLDFHKADNDVIGTIRILCQLLPEANLVAKITPVVSTASYSHGRRGHLRIYFNSNEGSFYWDNLDKKYESKEFDIENADLDPGVQFIFNKWHVSDIDSLFKKIQSWWISKQELRVGEEKMFKTSTEEKNIRSYLSKNWYFDYLETEDEVNDITTIRLMKFKKSGGRRVYPELKKFHPQIENLLKH